jgi:hypothetical protein
MEEHVHEWVWTGSMWEPYECKQCGAGVTLTKEQADARINATERLSAEDARVIGQVHEGKTEDMLRAYADTLEGKS